MAFDTKKFIKEVEKKGVLWKAPALGQSKIQEYRQKAWEEIGEAMFSNWNTTNQVTREARSKCNLKYQVNAIRLNQIIFIKQVV